MSDLIRIGGLWLNTTRAGKQYISGNIGYAGKILIFDNDNKQKPSDPDYIMYIGAKQRKDEDDVDLVDADSIPF